MNGTGDGSRTVYGLSACLNACSYIPAIVGGPAINKCNLLRQARARWKPNFDLITFWFSWGRQIKRGKKGTQQEIRLTVIRL